MPVIALMRQWLWVYDGGVITPSISLCRGGNPLLNSWVLLALLLLTE